MSNPIKLLVTFLLSGASLYLFVSIQWSTRYKIAATILKTRNSKLETRNSKLETRNSKLETRNSKLANSNLRQT